MCYTNIYANDDIIHSLGVIEIFCAQSNKIVTTTAIQQIDYDFMYLVNSTVKIWPCGFYFVAAAIDIACCLLCEKMPRMVLWAWSHLLSENQISRFFESVRKTSTMFKSLCKSNANVKLVLLHMSRRLLFFTTFLFCESDTIVVLPKIKMGISIARNGNIMLLPFCAVQLTHVKRELS